MSSRPRRFRGVVLLAVALLAVAGGCVRRPVRGVEVRGLDRKLSTFAFVEEGDLVTLIVDSRATMYREEAAFIPLEVCVANHALRRLTLTRESFELVDAQGNRYAMASPRDLLEGYPYLDMDARLAELEGIVFNRFAAYQRYFSQFTPQRIHDTESGAFGARGGSFPGSVVRDRITLPRFGYMIDFLYFPRPVTGVRGQAFELHVRAAELPHPIFVKFEVP